MLKNLPTFFIFMLLFHFILVQSEEPLAPALYVFGDSLSDSGNNNWLLTVAKANYLPYGEDFIHGATGRFTNGMTSADFIAQFIGLPFAPPYFSTLPFERSKILTGFNYASGGAGILDETGKILGLVVPLNKQLDAFEATVKNEICKQLKDPTARAEYLSKSIFLVNVGSNDYLDNYLQSLLSNTSKNSNPQEFAQDLIQRLSLQLKRLYDLGARKFMIAGLGPIGCLPNQIITQPDSHGGCVDRVNQIVSEFNVRLPPQIMQLNSTLSDSFFAYMDVNETITDIIQNPFEYGLTVLDSPCCHALGHGASTCIIMGKTCPNRNQYFYFDGYHPTEAVNRIVFNKMLESSYSICSSGCTNIHQLAKL